MEKCNDLSLNKPSVYYVSCSMNFSKTMVDSRQVGVDEQGVLHIRNQVYENTAVTGGFVGINEHNVFNSDIVLATAEGRSWGRNRSTVTWVDRNISGTLTGECRNRIVGGQMKGSSSYIGCGGFAGLIAKARQEEIAPGSLVLNMKWAIFERNGKALDFTVE